MSILHRFTAIFGTGLISYLILTNLFADRALSSQFANGTVVFDKSPRLLDAVTTFNNVRAWGATYYFTIELPQEAGEPINQVVISQRQGSEDIDFFLDKTVAVKGEYGNKGEAIALQKVNQDEKTKAITVVFESPVEPGTTFSIGLKPKENPSYSGIYLFGVTAIPLGEKPQPLYLGVGRLTFYSGSDNFDSMRHFR
jgi:hypothetical protein